MVTFEKLVQSWVNKEPPSWRLIFKNLKPFNFKKLLNYYISATCLHRFSDYERYFLEKFKVNENVKIY